MKRYTKSYHVPFVLITKNILEKDPGRKLTITALALEIGINASKLRTGFKKMFKKTIHQYRLELRLELSKKLLIETDLTIAEIAHTVGFDSRDGFARSFRRWFKESPREWRKNIVPLYESPFHLQKLLRLCLTMIIWSSAVAINLSA